MAIPCQGFTFTWGGSALSQVQEMEADLFGTLPSGRTTNWSSDGGEVMLVGFSIANLATIDYGRRRRLTIVAPTNTSGGTLTVFDADCMYQGVNIRAAANDAMRFAYVFRVMDTVDAPTNP